MKTVSVQQGKRQQYIPYWPQQKLFITIQELNCYLRMRGRSQAKESHLCNIKQIIKVEVSGIMTATQI